MTKADSRSGGTLIFVDEVPRGDQDRSRHVSQPVIGMTVAQDNSERIVERKPSEELVPGANPIRNGGGLLPVDETSHVDQESSSHRPQTRSAAPPVHAPTTFLCTTSAVR